MHTYGVADVEKLLRLPRSTINALIKAGFVTPTRGARKTWRFSFQDLIVLRTAQSLTAARVPARRINRALKDLRRQLPETMPLSGLAIGAVGERVVVKDGAGRRQVDSGQYLLAFEGDPVTGALSVIERPQPPRQVRVENWYERAMALEADNDAGGAMEAYGKAIEAEPGRTDARVNLGRLLHEAGRLTEAERVYRAGLAVREDPLLLYNLGVVLEDLKRVPEAMRAYEAALRGDPALGDAHYNLALLYEKLRRPRDAIRHMAQYRRLASRA